MKIPMKEHTPHNIVDIFEYEKKHSDRYPTSSETQIWPYNYIANKFEASRVITVVQEVEPYSQIISFKAGKAYLNKDICQARVNFPYQYIFWVFKVVEHSTMDIVKITRLADFRVLYSPVPWNESNNQDQITYRPWLSNIVQFRKNGAAFCYLKNYFNTTLKMDEYVNFQDSFLPSHMEKLVKEYDIFMGQCFNSDAGGLRLQNSAPRTYAIITPFKKVAALKESVLLDPNSSWYKNHAIPNITIGDLKKLYEESSK